MLEDLLDDDVLLRCLTPNQASVSDIKFSQRLLLLAQYRLFLISKILFTIFKSRLISTPAFTMARHHNNEYVDGTTTGQSKSRSLLQHVLRVFQFLSATTSLILFSIRIAKIIRLAGRASRSNGAVEGILAAAVAYTLLSMCMRFVIRGGGSNILRILFIIMDLLFVAAFIVVAVLTSPKRHGSSAPCSKSSRINSHIPGAVNCNLPWGTFILAIVST